MLLWGFTRKDFNVNPIIGWIPVLLYHTGFGSQIMNEKSEKRCGPNSEATQPSRVKDQNRKAVLS